MKSLIRLSDYTKQDIFQIFEIADNISKGEFSNFLNGKTVVMFFSSSSIRTRVTFEKGIYLLGGQSILFPSESLDKKENICDVVKYLNNWANILIVRHRDIQLIDKMDIYSNIPVINAMTNVNHPCEILSDLYALSKVRKNFLNDKYLFCGVNGNIGLTWKSASEVMGFNLSQCCPKCYEINDINVYYDIETAVRNKDIICTDSIPTKDLPNFKDYQITKSVMNKANKLALLNPCPPFYRSEEVSDDVINSDYFVGYDFKKCLLEVQQAIIIHSMLS